MIAPAGMHAHEGKTGKIGGLITHQSQQHHHTTPRHAMPMRRTDAYVRGRDSLDVCVMLWCSTMIRSLTRVSSLASSRAVTLARPLSSVASSSVLSADRLNGRMAGKVAVITGASAGIGRETALLFAREGAKGLVLADMNESQGAETAALVHALNTGTKAVFLKTDVSKESQCQQVTYHIISYHTSVK